MRQPYLSGNLVLKKLNNATINVNDSPIIKCLFFNDAMSSASFITLALFCRIFKYKFGMNNKMVFKLSCVVGIKDINQSNRHYNTYSTNKEADEKSAYNNVQVGDGPQQREIRKEILQAMQVGEGQQI
ncbi:hypothetical protein ACV566_02275 [Staphylococcus aureus]